MKLCTTIAILGVAIGYLPCYGQHTEGGKGLGLAAQLSSREVTAVVLEVERGQFPEVELKLRSEHDGTAYARPVYNRTEGRAIDFGDPQNVAKIAAYYLLPGDVVTVTLFGPRRGKTHMVWEIRKITRHEQPEPLAAGRWEDGKLGAYVATERESYAKGDPIRFAFRVKNVSRETAGLSFRSGQQYEFVVYRNEYPVWHWSKGRAFTMAVQTKSLEPGEELVFSEDWNQMLDSGRQAGPGIYKVVAELKTSGAHKAEAYAIFEIE